ncbi:MAG: hypothetical protein KQH57_08730 [Actinomycetales bacterium]|nr:hypothetical protein [Actinomycetales bacterium]
MAAKARTWVALAVVAALAVMAGGWFFLISPKMTQAADTRESVSDAEMRTTMLMTQLATLKKQFADLDTYKAQLAELQAQIPATDDMAEYRRALAADAAAAGVTILTITTATPILVPAAVPAAAATAAADATATDATTGTASDGSASDTGASTTADATPAPVSAASRLVGVPLSITVLGEYSKAMAFLSTLQTGVDRLFVLGSLSSTAQTETPESPGRPATAAGDVQLGIDGYVLVLPPSATDTAAGSAADAAAGDGTTSDAQPEATPLPSSQRNPFAPLP